MGRRGIDLPTCPSLLVSPIRSHVAWYTFFTPEIKLSVYFPTHGIRESGGLLAYLSV
jgi:hypothetical protein